MIGLLHSKPYDPDKIGQEGYASLPSDSKEEIENRPFVLVTHNKIKHPKTWLGSYYHYQENPRDLVIWDESLLFGEATNFSVFKLMNDLSSVHNGYKFKFSGTPEASQYEGLMHYLHYIGVALEEARDQEDVAISFPERYLPFNELSKQLNDLLQGDDRVTELKQLLDCLNYEGELRYIKESQGAIIHFRQTVPEELDNIAILDASHCLRELTQSDPTIEEVKMDCPKSYKNLIINYFMNGAGRGSVEEEFFKKSGSKLVEEVIDLIHSLLIENPNESILIWTFKRRDRRNRSIEDVIRKRLQEKNPDLDLEALNAEGEKILNCKRSFNRVYPS
jgi:hypothetical protein